MGSEWQGTVGSIQDATAYLLATATFSDVLFLVGEAEHPVHAHKLLLSARSAVFEALLERWGGEAQPKIYVPEVGLHAFNAFLKFLYTDDWSEVGGDAAQVLHLAHVYEVRVLSKICAHLLSDAITSANALQMYKVGKELEQTDLHHKAAAFILKHAEDVFEEEEFLSTDVNLLGTFLASDQLIMREVDVFRAVMRWAENACCVRNVERTSEQKRALGERAILLVRFTLMDPEEFTAEVVYKESGVLSEQEVIQVYIFFNSSPGSRARVSPLPFNTRPREGVKEVGKQGRGSVVAQPSATLPTAHTKSPFFSFEATTARKRKQKKRTWLRACL